MCWICSLSGGLFFAKPMRDKEYITMMDPFQIKYGNVLSGALVLPSLLGDILWVSCTLLGLGENTHTRCFRTHDPSCCCCCHPLILFLSCSLQQARL